MEDARRGIVTTNHAPIRPADLAMHRKAIAERQFVERARAAKVEILLALVPPSASDAEANELARVLESWDQARRDTFAAAAGCNSPSSDTWALLCTRVRA